MMKISCVALLSCVAFVSCGSDPDPDPVRPPNTIVVTKANSTKEKFSQTIRRENSDGALKSVRFYLSKSIILQRELPEATSVVTDGKIITQDGRRYNVVKFPSQVRGGIASFEGDTMNMNFGLAHTLAFSPKGQYSWYSAQTNGSGSVKYGDYMWDLNGEGSYLLYEKEHKTRPDDGETIVAPGYDPVSNPGF